MQVIIVRKPRPKVAGTEQMTDAQRAELYKTIGYHDYEALDSSIVATVIPQGMPQPS